MSTRLSKWFKRTRGVDSEKFGLGSIVERIPREGVLMKYSVVIHGSGDNPVEISVPPETFSIRQVENSKQLHLSWSKEDFKDRPREYLAICEAWPGGATVSLTHGPLGYGEFFSGISTGVGYDKEYLTLEATEKGS